MKRMKALILALALLLTGCADGAQYEWNDVYRRIMEPYGYSFAVQGNMKQTQVDGRIYEFEASVSEEQRNGFVQSQEKLCKLLAEHGLDTAGLTFRVLAEYPNRTESDQALAYFGVETVRSWQQVLTTVQAVLGDYTNYGYLYALANGIAGELKWERDKLSGQSELTDAGLLDLVYPCFDGDYTAAQDIVNCKALALELLERAEDIWSEAVFLAQREAYAAEHGLAYTPTWLTFAYNGESCPLKFRTRYLEVFRDHSYVMDDACEAGEIGEDYMASAGKIIRTYEWLDGQLESLRERFGVEDSGLVSVQLMDALPELYRYYFESGGLYIGGEQYIYATTAEVLAHEYVHHLYHCAVGGEYGEGYEQWHNEVLAYYYTLGGIFESHQRYFNANGLDPSGRINEAFDEPEDMVTLLRANRRLEDDPQYEYHLKYYNDLCACFGEYFVRVYGEEALIACMLDVTRTEEYTGKDIEQIVDDWCVDMADPAMD